MTNRELERRYIEMRLTYKNLVNANVGLLDENERVKEENERLNNIINELEKELDRGYRDLFEYELVPCRELITNIKNYLQELKGSDKE